MWYNVLMTKEQDKKKNNSSIIFLVACIAIGAIIGIVIVQKQLKPMWQKELDTYIAKYDSEYLLKQFVEDQFAATLSGDEARLTNPDGQSSTALMRYEYVASRTGYTCVQTGEYVDDMNTAPSTFVSCTKQ